MTSRLLNSNLEKHLGRQPNLTMSLCSLTVQVLEKYIFSLHGPLMRKMHATLKIIILTLNVIDSQHFELISVHFTKFTTYPIVHKMFVTV